MVVATNELTNIVLQNIETWSSAQNHELGYETLDQSTGKRYRYSQHTAGAFTVASGVPAGPYVNGANAVYTANFVTDDASAATTGRGIVGVYRGAATSANKFGFIEIAEKNLPTTVLASFNAVAQGNLLEWDADGYLNSVGGETPVSTEIVVSIVAVALDSHIASSSGVGTTPALIGTNTAITVRWL